MATLNLGKQILIFDWKVKVGFVILLILNKGFSLRIGLLCHQFSKSRFHDHFRIAEIWDDLVIKWLFSHCIRQHIYLSKRVLVPSPDRSQDY